MTPKERLTLIVVLANAVEDMSKSLFEMSLKIERLDNEVGVKYRQVVDQLREYVHDDLCRIRAQVCLLMTEVTEGTATRAEETGDGNSR